MKKLDVNKERLWEKITLDERMPQNVKGPVVKKKMWMGISIFLVMLVCGLCLMFNKDGYEKLDPDQVAEREVFDNKMKGNSEYTSKEHTNNHLKGKPKKQDQDKRTQNANGGQASESIELLANSIELKSSNEGNVSSTNNDNNVNKKKVLFEDEVRRSKLLNEKSKGSSSEEKKNSPANLNESVDLVSTTRLVKANTAQEKEYVNELDAAEKMNSRAHKGDDQDAREEQGSREVQLSDKNLNEATEPINLNRTDELNHAQAESFIKQSQKSDKAEVRMTIDLEYLQSIALKSFPIEKDKFELEKVEILDIDDPGKNMGVFLNIGYGSAARSTTDSLGIVDDGSTFEKSLRSYQFELGLRKAFGPLGGSLGVGADIAVGKGFWSQVDTVYNLIEGRSSFAKIETTRDITMYQRYGNVFLFTGIDYQFSYEKWSLVPQLGVRYNLYNLTNGSYLNEASLSKEDMGDTSSKQKFALSFGFSLQRKLSERLSLSLGAKYETRLEYDLPSGSTQSIRPIYLSLGGQYEF